MFMGVRKFLLRCCVEKDVGTEVLQSAFISVKVSGTIIINVIYVCVQAQTYYLLQSGHFFSYIRRSSALNPSDILESSPSYYIPCHCGCCQR
jgi:hypothetical protein